MDKKRSIGVTIFGIIVTLFGGLPIVGLLILFLVSIGKDDIVKILTLKNDSISQTLFLFLAYLFFLISGIGILKLKNWARVILITLISINFIASLIGLCFSIIKALKGNINLFYIISAFISLLIFVFVVYFFTRPKVKGQFK